MRGEPFFDTNVVAYAFLRDDPRKAVARDLIAAGGAISVQVLNEFVAVARRKTARGWEQIAEALDIIWGLCPTILPLTAETHREAVRIARRYGYHIFDSLILASALEAGSTTVYSEDMRDGQKIEGLTIRNPFK